MFFFQTKYIYIKISSKNSQKIHRNLDQKFLSQQNFESNFKFSFGSLETRIRCLQKKIAVMCHFITESPLPFLHPGRGYQVVSP